MKFMKFQKIPRAEVEKEAFDIQTNNGRALLLQNLLQSADRVLTKVKEYETIIFLKEIDGSMVRYEVVNVNS